MQADGAFDLTVILPADRFETIREIMASLGKQAGRKRLEIVIAAPSAEHLTLPDDVKDGFGAIRVVEVGEGAFAHLHEARAAADDVTVREADRLTRDLRAAIDSPPPLAEHDRQALVERLKAALALVAPKLHDLREMDEWKRFANAAVQEELIAQTEALRTKYHLDAEEIGRASCRERVL